IYGHAACSGLLGFFTLIGTSTRERIEGERNANNYADLVIQHVQDVHGSVLVSTLTGMALMGASLVQQHYFANFGLFHAYIVLLLLWVIALTGMWFAIHAWVFDILRKEKQRMATFSFWRRIVLESKWFTLHLSLMGGYGIYVTLKRDTFQEPHIIPRFFKNKLWSLFIYSIAAAPILNSCMLFMITSLVVWVLSVLVALSSHQGWSGQVEPRVFCVFWLLEYILIITGLVITIEFEVQKYTPEVKEGWSFGSTLAVALTIIPLRLVAMRLWQLLIGTGAPRANYVRTSSNGTDNSCE
ncbi:hypothetical protein FRC08_015738, partial [Ceratobasidium sp. 394]